MSDVFISYSSRDREFADGLAKSLEEWGHRVFYDQKLKAGEKWPARLDEELRRAQFVLVLLSPDYLKSPWATSELERSALLEAEGKARLIPLLIRPTPIPPFLRDKYYADFSGDVDTAFSRVREALAEPKPSAARRAVRAHEAQTLIGVLLSLLISAISALAWLVPFGGGPTQGFIGTVLTVLVSVVGLTALVALMVAYRSSRQPRPVEIVSRDLDRIYIDALNRSELNPLRIGGSND